MDFSAVNNSTFATNATLQIAQPANVSSQFAALMHHAQNNSPASEIEQSARQLLGVALFQPLLAQAHESPFKTELFHGGAGEKAFQGQLDQVLADRMAQRPDYPLVKAIVNKFSKQVKSAGAAAAAIAKVDTHG